MTPRPDTAALLWAAALCAICALTVAATTRRTQRRARHLFHRPAPRSPRWRDWLAAARRAGSPSTPRRQHELRPPVRREEPPRVTPVVSAGPDTEPPRSSGRRTAESREGDRAAAAGLHRVGGRSGTSARESARAAVAVRSGGRKAAAGPGSARTTGAGRVRPAGRDPGGAPTAGAADILAPAAENRDAAGRERSEVASASGRRAGARAKGKPGPEVAGSAGLLVGRTARPWSVEVGCGLGGGVVGVATGSVLPVLGGLAAGPVVRRVLRRRAELAAAERGAAAVSALCGTVAGDLRAGRPPHTALADAVEASGWAGRPELAPAAAALLSATRFGGDVPEALRTAGRRQPGLRGLTAMAACWQVAVDGGAGLAAALDRLAAALRAEADQREDLRAQLAGPRSTAVLLALLPLFGLVLGSGLGADPSAVLLHTPVGLACLAAGAALEWAGLAWTARIIRTAEGGRRSPPGAPRAPRAQPKPVAPAAASERRPL